MTLRARLFSSTIVVLVLALGLLPAIWFEIGEVKHQYEVIELARTQMHALESVGEAIASRSSAKINAALHELDEAAREEAHAREKYGDDAVAHVADEDHVAALRSAVESANRSLRTETEGVNGSTWGEATVLVTRAVAAERAELVAAKAEAEEALARVQLVLFFWAALLAAAAFGLVHHVMSLRKGLDDVLSRCAEIAEGHFLRTTPPTLRTDELGALMAQLDVMGASLQRMNTDLTSSAVTLAQSQKMAGVGQLASGIAHEINSPVQFIESNATFLASTMNGVLDAASRSQDQPIDKELRGDVVDALDGILQGVQRIASIVGAMRSFAHPTTGERERVDLREIIDVTATVARNEWKYVADLEIESEGDLHVLGWRDQLGQVLLNLIVNATHAIEERHGAQQRGHIHISARASTKDGDTCEVRVRDDGAGIKPEHMQRIFDAFFTTKPVGKGTGQGLAIVWSIIAKHGGTIRVESVPGEGTTFIVSLPRIMPLRLAPAA